MVQVVDNVSDGVANAYLDRLAETLGRVPREPVAQAIDLLLTARETGHRVYIMGNGGSAATASHFVCDLVKTARVDGLAPLRAFALTDNTALMTAWANDTAYDRTFAEQIHGLVEPGDLVIAISASGNSPNIISGLRAAAERRARTVALVGFKGGQAPEFADVTIHVPVDDYGLVEDAHSALGHAITAAVRRVLTDHR